MEINIYPFPKYNIKFKKYKEDYALRTAHIKTDDDLLIHEHDYEFEEWDRESLKELNTILQNEIKELNENKIFFYGCNLTNYKSNYQKRIDDFLANTEDATELDFIEEEIEYFENSIYDIENAEASHDGYSVAGIHNFLYLIKIVEAIGFRQFSISTNKIIEFLKDRKNELSKKTINVNPNDANTIKDKLNTIKTAELNLDNLIAFGLDPNTTNEEANIWERENEDILIDFKNKIIYYNLIALKNEIGYLSEQLENEAKNINSEEDIQTFVNHVALEAKSDLKTLFNSMPKENLKEFVIMFYKNVDEKVSSIKTDVFSSKISDFINKNPSIHNSKRKESTQEHENPYPRIFKDYNAYLIFQNLLNEFGNTKENLSNYSYAFHKMTYEGLINYDILQKTYFNMLSEFDITIDRIKTESAIGKKAFRDSIYNKAKATT